MGGSRGSRWYVIKAEGVADLIDSLTDSLDLVHQSDGEEDQ